MKERPASLATHAAVRGAPIRSCVPVTFLLEDMDFGGTQTQMLELAVRLDKTRFLPRLITLRRGRADLWARAKAGGVDCLALDDGIVFRPSRALPALWRYLEKERPPLLHLATALPNIWGRIMGRLLRLPGIIANCRGGNSIRRQHERWLWPFAGVHICNSSLLQEQLRRHTRLPEERIVYIPNGVDTDFFHPADAVPEELALLCIARMVPDKNHPLLLRAFSRVLHYAPDAVLHLVGEGRERARVEALAAAPELRGRVRFHSGSADVRPLLHQSRIFVLASDYESTPNVLLEAMACGLPVAATRAGGVSELVIHGQTGFLTDCGDSGALADAVLRLLNEPDLRRAFGGAGRERALARYSLRAMAEAHERVYESLLHRGE
ncbi:MAG: glycosyltransferase [Desulfovibrio sp.]|jgi:glycosyltransferase involved in cell wall biosynthesis|nr:glycosyltransferase [Desulfovibrio sp.]